MAPLLIPESLEVQVVTLSDEVRILTELPPDMNVLFPKEIDIL